MNREAAETVALKALAWIARDDELLGVFLGATGADIARIRAHADDPDLLVSVLEFLAMDDAWVQAFCAEEGLDNHDPMTALAALPGGGRVHWT